MPPVRSYLSVPKRWKAIRQLEEGQHQKRVTTSFGVSQSVISRLWQTGEVKDQAGRGWKPKTDRHDDHLGKEHKNYQA